MRRIGNREDVKKCRNADKEVIDSLEKCAGEGFFKQWKNKVTATQRLHLLYYEFLLHDKLLLFLQFPPELIQKMDAKNKAYPDNMLGLLRFIRNLHEH